MVIRKLLIQDFRLDGLLHEVSRVRFANGSLDAAVKGASLAVAELL
jgi:hypothetical protein